jgi:HEAT repeat protein
MHWCYSCYAVNPDPSGPCVRCGHPIEGPADQSYDDRLIWALGHPDGDRAVLAAQTLGARGVRSALPALRRAVDADRDPYLAVAALRGAIAIAGSDELRAWLEELTRSESFMVREVAQQALAAV